VVGQTSPVLSAFHPHQRVVDDSGGNIVFHSNHSIDSPGKLQERS